MDNDTRVTVTVWDATNPYHYGEVRGTVIGTTTGPDAADHINALSEKYTGGPYASGATDARIICRIAPDRQRMT